MNGISVVDSADNESDIWSPNLPLKSIGVTFLVVRLVRCVVVVLVGQGTEFPSREEEEDHDQLLRFSFRERNPVYIPSLINVI